MQNTITAYGINEEKEIIIACLIKALEIIQASFYSKSTVQYFFIIYLNFNKESEEIVAIFTLFGIMFEKFGAYKKSLICY